ncbi:MAG: DUF1735 domain-containing protein [Bacteroidales bacterium]|nr:DUF1735 domain-containing protein [Bacteroidales bacterium]
MKKILFTIATLVLAASCIEDSRNNFMVPDSISLVFSEQVVPVSVYAGSAPITVQKSGMGTQGAKVTLGVSSDSLAAYNTANSTAYTELASSKYNFSSTALEFGASDVTSSVKVQWTPSEVFAALDGANSVIPVVIAEASPLTVNTKRNLILLNILNSTVGLVNTPGLVKMAPKAKTEDLEISLQVAVDNPLPMDLKITLATDNAYVATYNEQNGAECIAAPAGYVQLPAEGYTLQAGASDCYCAVTLKNSALFNGSEMMDFESIAVPFKISATSENGIVITDKVVYLVVNSPNVKTGLVRVWGKFWKDDSGWAAPLVPDLDGRDRNLAIDDNFVYIPQTSPDVAAIHKFDLQSGAYLGTLPVNADMNVGLHWVSCARMMANTDEAVNGGKDFLVVSNLAEGGQKLVFAAYVNGTGEAPVTLYNVNSTRRFGDKFTVWGSYQLGKFFLRSFDDDGMTAHIYLPANAERTAGNYTQGIWGWLEPNPGKLPLNDANCISEYTLIPDQSKTGLISTTSDEGLHLLDEKTEVAKYPTLARCFGFNFFKYKGQDCIAFVSLADKAKPKLVVLKGSWTSTDALKDALDNQVVLYEAPLGNKDDLDQDSLQGGHSVGDCCVRIIDGKVYIAAMAQRSGLSVFTIN